MVDHEDLTSTGSAAARPRDMVLTVYGLYARDSAGWIGVSHLVRLLSRADVDEQAVRSSISRLKRRGLLDARQVDGTAGYALSEQAGRLLSRGDRRIFDRVPARLDDGWVLAVFSVPESQRSLRHQLRSRLALNGFGTVGPGVWIAPAGLEPEIRDLLARDDLDRYVDLFVAHYRNEGLAHEVTTWWDLETVAERYREFVAEHAPLLKHWNRARRTDPGRAFADYVRVLTGWRSLPFADPGLPAELLPPDWPGHHAVQVFDGLRARLAEPARAHVDEVRAVR